MALKSATCLGPYEILDLIGAGGMGEVYRARDTRLNREVAVKVLPQSFAANQDRMRRFTLEARSAGALNHPHILAIHDVGTHDGMPYIVSELLEGESLRARLNVGRLSVAKCVELARQIASGLAAAHAKGIVHRDIKPENLFLTKDGHVKILDFGLAKTQPQPSGEAAQAETESLATSPGTVVGTVAYMSPEQVRGEAVDHRSDIFSFGTVLYEMLTGQRAFHAATAVETMNAVLKAEPPDLSSMDGAFPQALGRIVRHCLEKHPEGRFQSAGDLAFDLEALSQVSSNTAAKAQPVGRWKRVIVGSSILAALGIVVVASVLLTRRPEPATRASMHLSITLPSDAPLAPAGMVSPAHDRPALALSPDGSRLAYVAQIGEKTQICVRDMTNGKVTPVPGTEGGHTPFFSPDGASIGFFASGKLKRTSPSGGAILVLADAPNPWGAVWGSDDTIYFNRYEGEGIFGIAASGGPVQVVTGSYYYMPEVLDRKQPSLATSGTETVAFDSDQAPRSVVGGFGARYVSTGHLLYAVQGALMAVPFDRSRMEVTGPPVSLFEDLRTANYGVAQFTFAQNGTLVYASGRSQMMTSFVWVDRSGKTRPVGLPEGLNSAFDLSPDGRRLALTDAGETGKGEIWIYDLLEGTMSRLTPRTSTGSPAENRWPRWTPDSRHVLYHRRHESQTQLLKAPADGSAEPVVLWSSKATGRELLYPMSFSPDGSVLAVFGPTANKSFDIWLMPMENTGRPPIKVPELFLGTRYGEAFGQISPNGRWMLYSSDQSGKYEVYVTSYPKPGAIHQISRDGGREPMWNPSAPEIVYLTGRRMHAVEVTLGPEFRAGEPRLLFEGPYPDVPGFSFDMTQDGKQFMMLENKDFLTPARTLTVITNFFDELRRRVPSARGKQ